ncbi:glycosyltransferase family 2 protein [Deltaproteobacteria bacterium]|nr:glycosyltransferase family 2 protein [Deltaproteobacteria bacterium]
MMQPVSGDIVQVSEMSSLDLSVVCPFYNEGQIIGDAIDTMLSQLGRLDVSWELIVVDDGSRDNSGHIARKKANEHEQLRALGYPYNRGRGHALRTGIVQARGEVIVTTEIDLSWGDDIVEQLYRATQEQPDVDIVIASPHMPGGEYKNVPFKRVFFSRFGNFVIRALMSNAVTMNTGMTRAYRRDAIRSLPLDEDKKEFHLEVILKAQALGYRFSEIPATLEWKEYKHQGVRVERKSSSKINKLVLSHSLFSLFANPIRYVWGLAILSLLGSMGFLGWAVVRVVTGEVSVYAVIVSLALAITGLTLFGFGLMAQQSNMIQRELWLLKRDLKNSSWSAPSEDSEYTSGG